MNLVLGNRVGSIQNPGAHIKSGCPEISEIVSTFSYSIPNIIQPLIKASSFNL
jgi:hypothetical protein